MTPVEAIAALTAQVATAEQQLRLVMEAYDKLKAAYDATADERNKLFEELNELRTSFNEIVAQVIPAVEATATTATDFLSRIGDFVNPFNAPPPTEPPTA